METRKVPPRYELPGPNDVCLISPDATVNKMRDTKVITAKADGTFVETFQKNSGEVYCKYQGTEVKVPNLPTTTQIKNISPEVVDSIQRNISKDLRAELLRYLENFEAKYLTEITSLKQHIDLQNKISNSLNNEISVLKQSLETSEQNVKILRSDLNKLMEQFRKVLDTSKLPISISVPNSPIPLSINEPMHKPIFRATSTDARAMTQIIPQVTSNAEPQIVIPQIASSSPIVTPEKLNRELEEQKLQEQKLQEQKLQEQKLQEQRLQEQKLQEQRLQEQKLQEQRLQEQKLQEQKLQEQKLQEQKLQEQRLQEQKLQEQRLQEQKLQEQKLQEQRLQEQKLQEQKLQEQRLQEQKLSEQKVQEVVDQSKSENNVHDEKNTIEDLQLPKRFKPYFENDVVANESLTILDKDKISFVCMLSSKLESPAKIFLFGENKLSMQFSNGEHEIVYGKGDSVIGTTKVELQVEKDLACLIFKSLPDIEQPIKFGGVIKI